MVSQILLKKKAIAVAVYCLFTVRVSIVFTKINRNSHVYFRNTENMKIAWVLLIMRFEKIRI